MNLLITGSCGHIGSFLSHNVHKIKGIKKCYLVDNFHSTNLNSIFNISKKNKLDFNMIDISKKDSLNRFKNIDYLIHLASMTNAAGSFKRKNEMYRNNINCMNNVIKFCY